MAFRFADEGTPTTAGPSRYRFEGELQEEEVEGPSLGERIAEEAPQTIGGIAGGLTAAKLASPMLAAGPPGWAGFVLATAAGAGVGGASGKGYQLSYKSLTGAEDAPANSYDAAVQMAAAGAEEAAWDLGGQVVGKTLAKGWHFLRPKAIEGVEKLAVQLEKQGGGLTAAQRTDSWLIHQLDSMTRGSLTGSGRMKSADVLNEAALRGIETELRQKIAKDVTTNLSDGELGELFLNTVRDGRGAHRTVVNELYGGFDDLVPTQTKTITVNTAEGPRSFTKEIKPVSTGKLKEAILPFKNQLERIKYAGIAPEEKKVLDSIFMQDETLSFTDAQALRSNFLDVQRNLENNLGKSKVTNKINTVVDELTKAMDEAALNQGPEVLSKYKAIKKYAQKGYKVFDNKFIADMVVADKKNPERIGEYLFRAGNVAEVMKAKKAIRYAGTFNKSIKYDDVWTKMQSGYLDDVLTRSGKNLDIAPNTVMEDISKDVSGAKLLQEFTDPKKRRTLMAVFDKEQRNAILDFAKVAERVQRKPEGGLGMVMQLTQGGALAGAAMGKLEAGEAAAVFVPTYVLSRMMTSPKYSRMMATALETPQGSGRASAIIAQISQAAYKVMEGEQQ